MAGQLRQHGGEAHLPLAVQALIFFGRGHGRLAALVAAVRTSFSLGTTSFPRPGGSWFGDGRSFRGGFGKTLARFDGRGIAGEGTNQAVFLGAGEEGLMDKRRKFK